jgi:hypothetical protein
VNKSFKWMGAVALTLLASASGAQTEFDFSGTLETGGTVIGDVVVNTNSGAVISGVLTIDNELANTQALDGVYTLQNSESTQATFESLTQTSTAYLDLDSPATWSGIAGGIFANITVDDTIAPLITDHTLQNFELGPLSAAPEIDPTSAASGLALLVGSLLVLRGRRTQRLAA